MAERASNNQRTQIGSEPVQSTRLRCQQRMVSDCGYDARKEAEEFIREKKDKKCLQVRFIDDVIGKGVFALRDFSKGEFLLEYEGELLNFKEGSRRMKEYPQHLGSYIYLFNFKNKKFWIDGTFSKQTGKFVNDAEKMAKENNSVMKLMEVDGNPHLALFSTRKIFKGEEICYDYGEKNLPWRKKKQRNRAEKKEDVKIKDCTVVLEKLDLRSLRIDKDKVSQQVDEIWSQSATTDFVLGNVHGINITDRDIRSLQGNEWLTDQVIDGYLKILCEAEMDKGRLVMHIPVQTMTSICTGKQSSHSRKIFSKHVLTYYETILGVCHLRGSHWILVILDPCEEKFYFFDSLGYSEKMATQIMHHWSEFLSKRPLEKQILWRLCQRDSSLQTDAYNCGVFSVMFADRFLTKLPLTGITPVDLQLQRRRVAEKLLRYEVNLKNACPCCGLEIHNEEKISCISCGRNFHKKSFCVGEENITDDIMNILCRGCNQKLKLMKHSKTETTESSLYLDKQDSKEEENLDLGSEEMTETCNEINNQDFKEETEEEKLDLGSEETTGTCKEKDNQDFKEETEEEKLDLGSEETTGTCKEKEVNDAAKKKKPYRPCPFCDIQQSALTRHIQKCHRGEEEVKAAMNLPGPERRQAFKNMKRKGIYQHNAQVMKSKELDIQSVSELIRERNTGTCLSTTTLVMCSLCKAFLKKTNLYRHKRLCKGAEETTTPPTGISLKVLKEVEYPVKYHQFLEKFHTDDVGETIKGDTFIKEFGFMEFQSLEGTTIKLAEKLNTLRSKLRRLARLFIYFKTVASEAGVEVKGCDDMFCVKGIKLLSTAVNGMTQDSEGDIKSGLKLGLRSLILEVSNSIYATQMLMQEEDKALDVEKFQKVLKIRWKSFFDSAQEAILKKRQNESRDPKHLPTLEEIRNLGRFTKSNIKELVKNNMYSQMDQNSFCRLRNIIACRLTLFNARRGGEAARLTIAELNDGLSGKWVDKSLIQKCDDDDDIKKMSCEIKLSYLHSSKKTQLVPVIMPEDCWQGLKMLSDSDHRKSAGVHSTNEFVFANTEGSIDHVSGWQCVRGVFDKAGISRYITATGMRHYVATLYAAEDVSEEDRDFFILKHLGHSRFTNENIYQSPPGIRELMTAGKFLLKVDQGDEKDTEEDRDHANFSMKKELSTNDYENDIEVEKDCDNFSVKEELSTNDAKRKRNREDSCTPQFTKKSRKELPDEEDESDSSDDVVDPETIKEISSELDFDSKPKSQRHTWTEEEDRNVTEFFAEEIKDVTQKGNKGSLNIKNKMKRFIQQYPEFLKDYEVSKRKFMIRVKILNCRRRKREVFFHNLENIAQ
ncbi:uncharacterized protein LOC125662490 [Ostrea edulis]|uniref:uncharacterized protein LOC125662490 n=1 Tax=Ostrea edulis TaxID=37623 RepID=UPI0024AEA833|nr:uncharacterized protein LOC125662490 [Ostrea edulis]